MADKVYMVYRTDAVNGKPYWVATFENIKDVSDFSTSYMELHKYDDCPAGYPQIGLYCCYMNDGEVIRRDLFKTLYPNAHDCAYVEMVDPPAVAKMRERMAQHVRH